MEIYNRNGSMIRLKPITSELTEVELEFSKAKYEDRLVYALCTFYLALCAGESIDFVFIDKTRQRVVLKTEKLTDAVQRRLIKALTTTLKEGASLFGLAKTLFHGNVNKGTIQTNTDTSLAKFEGANFLGKELVGAFAKKIDWVE